MVLFPEREVYIQLKERAVPFWILNQKSEKNL